MNCLEREENSLSSRYGTQIVNRDPQGSGTSNHYFSSPVMTLSRLVYQGNAFRYAGLQNGTLQRRAGNTQGAYTQIYSGLSGNYFESVVANCYASSQAYIYIYDSNASIKDLGTGTPQLTGIDPSPWMAMTQPYSPLLTLIDSFASGNSYTTSNVTGWAHASVTTLAATNGQAINDFSEFFGIQQAGAMNYTPSSGLPATASVTVMGGSGNNTSGSVSGYTSVPLTAGDTINITVNVSASLSVTGGSGGGGGGVTFEYSTDSGTTWINFYGFGGSSTSSLPATNVPLTIPGAGLSNLNTIYFRVVATASSGGIPPPTVTITGTISAATAVVNTSGVFGGATRGMIALLSTNANTQTAIVSIASTTLTSGVYTQALVTTASAHGLTTSNYVSIYGNTNLQFNGYYKVASVPSSTTFAVTFNSPQLMTGTGGFVNYNGTTTPIGCVLSNLYSAPYPPQMSAWGFYQQVPTSTTSFPVGAWSGSVAASTTGTITVSGAVFDLSINNQVTDDDLIVLTLAVTNPQNVTSMRLQFDVGGSNYTTSYYYKNISPSYYQGNVANQIAAYQSTQQQILADTLNLITGQPPNTSSAQLQPAALSTGNGSWAALYMRRGDFLPVGTAGQSGSDWNNITGWQLSITTGSTGSTTVAANGLYLQWGYGPSSFAGTGYDWRYTYYNAATGQESNGTPIQNFNEQLGYLATLDAPIFLRQAGLIIGYWSADPQVTHIRVYRRGGSFGDNWRQVGQFPNVIGPVLAIFFYKDVIADAALQQAQILTLDNDPPVTSSLVNPILTTLSAATVNLMGNTPYMPLASPVQTVTVVNSSAVFVPTQIVLVGNANNLEEVRVVTGGTGAFSAVFSLQHNAGEGVQVNSLPRVACNICAVAKDGTVYLAGDRNNPNYAYYSNPGYPESFGPQRRFPVCPADDTVMAIVNWRGSIVIGTLKTWYIVVGGARPYAQPTGAAHGIISRSGWTVVEGRLWFQAVDGLREFTGANADYRSLPVEWIFQNNPLCLPPQAYIPSLPQSVMAYYNNVVYTSYISLNSGAAGPRYRLHFDTRYNRFRNDDVQATAMLWEQDINTFLVAKPMGGGNYAIVQDQVGDYDDGGWVAGALVQTPIALNIQSPYIDLKAPHNPKQWNQYETDVNTQGQTMTSTLSFEDGAISVPLTSVSTAMRQKVELKVNSGAGQQAYRASLQHTISVITAPILYQEDIYAAVLAEYSATFDTYWLKFGTDTDKFIKQGWFDYTSAYDITVNLYADNMLTPYFTFTLPAQSMRDVIRQRFGNVNNGTTAFTMRTWRMIGTLATDGDAHNFQMWANPRIEFKTVNGGSAYQVKELEV